MPIPQHQERDETVPIKLYNFAFGPYPQRLNIYLAEKQADNVEVILYGEPDRKAGVPPEAVKSLTPTGALPILENEGMVIGQSLAILEYLEERASGLNMLGVTATTRARTRQLVHVIDEAMTFFGLWARHGSRLGYGHVRISQDVAEICAARYFEQVRLIERMVDDSEFLTGDFVTVADCVAMATFQYAQDFYDVPIPDDCLRLRRWFASFSKRASAATPPYPESKRSIALGLMAQTGVVLQA